MWTLRRGDKTLAPPLLRHVSLFCVLCDEHFPFREESVSKGCANPFIVNGGTTGI
jgi:hypothetical protein